MHPILRRLLYLALIFFVIFVGLQPYNRFCNYSGKCNGIYLTDLIPGQEGKVPINAILEVRNQRGDFTFEVDEPQIIFTVSGRVNTGNYRIQNTENHTVTFRPEFYVQPKAFEKYVIRRECLCFREYSVKKGESLLVRSVFKIDSAIEKDPLFNKNEPNIVVGYSVKAAKR